jgi:hypothetical protein
VNQEAIAISQSTVINVESERSVRKIWLPDFSRVKPKGEKSEAGTIAVEHLVDSRETLTIPGTI